jgi:hypothetical protein
MSSGEENDMPTPLEKARAAYAATRKQTGQGPAEAYVATLRQEYGLPEDADLRVPPPELAKARNRGAKGRAELTVDADLCAPQDIDLVSVSLDRMGVPAGALLGRLRWLEAMLAFLEATAG